jgi:predicted dehydrogenase
MNSVRFCVIGCGRVAGNHLSAITQLGDAARLMAVCDLVEERARNYGQQYGVPHYTNYHEMLRREDCDVVAVITPSGMHPTHVIDVIQRYRKHIVVEKPLALRYADALAMKEAAAKAGVSIFPVYQNRYNKPVQFVKRALDAGELGKLALGSVRLHWCRPQRYYGLSPWRGTWAMDGGAYTNQGIHYLDLLTYLMGDVELVHSITATQLVDIEVEDTGVAVVRFTSGAVGSIEITTTARPDDAEATVTLLSEKGTVGIAGLSANRLATYSLDPSKTAEASEDIPNAYGHGHKPFIADVVRQLREGVPHPMTFDEGLRAIRLLNALYRSAEDSATVRLGDQLSSRRLGTPDARLAAMYTTPAPEVVQ